jgi:uroporphyrinogen decarboxylase
MNGYQRIVSCLQRREPDQIPLMELYIHPAVIEGLCPGGDLLDMVQALDLDGVCVQRGGGNPKDEDRPAEVVDDWGVRYGRSAEAYHPLEGPIHSEADLEGYTPPNPNDPALVEPVREAVARFKGQRFIAFHTAPDFMPAALLCGLPQMLVNLLESPRLAHRLLRMVNNYHCTLAQRAIEAGADGVVLAGDWAFNTGPFMSPAHFREFVYPYFKRCIDICHAGGVYTIKHSDGNLWPIMDLIAASGIDAINPLEPEAGMDLGEMKRRYGDRLCITGNISCGYTLSSAPLEAVEQEVRAAIRAAGPGGGYIMMSSNSLHSSVRPENYRTMVAVARRYGKYPLELSDA